MKTDKHSIETPQPLVSVLMTAYNREKYIEDAIDSVLESTYSNFELIIVDDCSTDRTVEIIRNYEKNDTRIKVHINKQNLGDYPNRNKAASYAKGKYLKYVDADDKIYPWGLEILVFYMERNPDAGFGLCSIPSNPSVSFPVVLPPREAYIYHFIHPGYLLHKAPLSSIIRKDVFVNENGFKSERMVSDYEMWLRLSLKYSVLAIHGGIVWYRHHDGQELNDIKKYQKRYNFLTMQYLNLAKERGIINDTEYSLIIKKRKMASVKHMIYWIYKMLKSLFIRK